MCLDNYSLTKGATQQDLTVSAYVPYAYRNDTIQHLGHLFTFGTSRKGAYSRQGVYLGLAAYFFIEEQLKVQNKTLLVQPNLFRTEIQTAMKIYVYF